MSGALNVLNAVNALGTVDTRTPFAVAGITLNPITGEVPTSVLTGGEQMLAETTLPGGVKVIQAMGPSPKALEWSAVFRGAGSQASCLKLEALRIAAAPVYVTFNTYRYLVVIASFVWSVQDLGFVAPYTLRAVVLPSAAASVSTSTASLSALVGSDLAAAITSVSNTVADVSQYAQTAIGQTQNIIGQVAPIATLVGLGGPLAHANDYLTAASVYAQAGTNFANIPAASASLIAGLGSAGSALADTIGSAGASLAGIGAAAPAGALVLDGPSLVAATGQAGALAGAVQTGALVNRAAGNAALATSSASLPVPVIHA